MTITAEGRVVEIRKGMSRIALTKPPHSGYDSVYVMGQFPLDELVRVTVETVEAEAKESAHGA